MPSVREGVEDHGRTKRKDPTFPRGIRTASRCPLSKWGIYFEISEWMAFRSFWRQALGRAGDSAI
jgi:hypothetical protein